MLLPTFVTVDKSRSRRSAKHSPSPPGRGHPLTPPPPKTPYNNPASGSPAPAAPRRTPLPPDPASAAHFHPAKSCTAFRWMKMGCGCWIGRERRSARCSWSGASGRWIIIRRFWRRRSKGVSAPRRGGGMFRAPARPTFVNSDKSRQKHRKEPPVPSPPGALRPYTNLRPYTTRSHEVSFFVLLSNRLCSCAAAANHYTEQRFCFYR